MKFVEKLSTDEKEYVYRLYRNVIGDASRAYEEISNQEMGEAVLSSFYENPVRLVELLTAGEMKLLKALCDGDWCKFDEEQKNRDMLIDFNLISAQESVVCEEIKELFLQVYDEEQIEKALKREAAGVVVRGILCAYGLLPKSDFEELAKLYQVEELYNGYVNRFMLYPDFGDGIEYIGYTKYVDDFEQLYHRQRAFRSDRYILEKSVIQKMGEKGLINWHPDMEAIDALIEAHIDEDVSKDFNPDMISWVFIKEAMLLSVLQADISILENYMEPMGSTSTKEERDILRNFVCLLPSPTLNGNSLVQYGDEESLFHVEEISDDVIQNAMIGEREAKHFYRLYFGLLHYINEQYQVVETTKDTYLHDFSPMDTVLLRDYLFEHLEMIDQYVSENPNGLTEAEKSLVKQFQKGFKSKFIVLKHEEEFTAMLDIASDVIYGVVGLAQNLTEILKGKIPMHVETALFPYQDRIIYDGVFSRFQIEMSTKMMMQLLEQYDKEQVITQIPVLFA